MTQNSNDVVGSWYSRGQLHPATVTRGETETDDHLLRRFMSKVQADWKTFPPDPYVAPPAPDFTLVLTPASVSVDAAKTATVQVSLAAVNGFSGVVSLAVAVQGGGTWASVSPKSISPGQTATLVLAPPAAMAGTKTVSVTGTSGNVSHVEPLAVIVSTPPMGGWTVPVPSADTRNVYLDPGAGLDTNDGLSISTPKRTLPAAKALLRDTFPDYLWIKAGSTLNQGFDTWNLSGRNATERMVVSTYGGVDRVTVNTGTANGFQAWPGQPVNHFTMIGMRFVANGYNGTNGAPDGVALFGSCKNVLFEDCAFEHYFTNLVVQGADEFPGNPANRHANVAIRRCVVVDAYAGTSAGDGGNAQGIFASGTDGLLVEECVFDSNGWGTNGSVPTFYRHNLYIQNLNTGVVVRGNTIANTDGCHVRSGGEISGNLAVGCAMSFIYGGGGYPNAELGGVTVTVKGNVVLDGGNLQAGQARGWAYFCAGNVVGGDVSYNVAAHNVAGANPRGFLFWVTDPIQDGVRRNTKNLNTHHNVVYDWGRGSNGTLVNFAGAQGLASALENCTFTDNDLQNPASAPVINAFRHDDATSRSGCVFARNRVWVASLSTSVDSTPDLCNVSGGNDESLTTWKARSPADGSSVNQQVTYLDPNRTLESYHATLGGTATRAAFLAEARKQSRANWRDAYTAKAVNDYVRAGFGLVVV